MSLRPLLLIHGVLEMLGTSLRGPPLPKHRQRWRRHVLKRVPGIGLGSATPDCRAPPAVRSGTTVAIRALNQLIGRLGPLVAPSLRNGHGSAARAVLSDRTLQPQRPGAAGGGVAGVLEPDHWNLAVNLLEAPEYRRGGRAG